MPELPEVETTVQDLKKLLGREIEDVWCNNRKMIKGESFDSFKKRVTGKKIKNARRRAKLVLLDLSENKTLLIHQKISGHLLLGKWNKKNGEWVAESEQLNKRVNGYLHLIFYLDNEQMLALSDLRKFAKARLWDTEKLKKSDQIQKLGPEPLSENFGFKEFKQVLKNRRAAIKKILMNQNIIAGIGNIYSDEILWRAKVNPFTPVNEISDKKLRKILSVVKSVLRDAIEARGTSISDYRDLKGEPGNYQEKLKVYHQDGNKCSRCNSMIKKEKIGSRSTHFCSNCQPKL